AKVISGSVNGSHILLTLDINSPNLQTLSFRGHVVNGSPCIRNLSGEGMVGFYKFPVIQGTPNPLSSSITSSQINILSLYPNPAKYFLSLQYQVVKLSQVTISIFNNKGISVYEFNAGSHAAGVTKTQLDISSLPKGIYVVKLRMGETTLSQKFIKE
ncbi:MAG: T9SS type A sorting domain-containing protein, partial [Parafilimonas sp.]